MLPLAPVVAQTSSPSPQQRPYPIDLVRYAAPSYVAAGAGMLAPLCEAGWVAGECGLVPTGEAWEQDQVSFATGGAMTHDGGLLLFTAGDNFIHDAEEFGVYATAVHFDRVTIDAATGQPDMSAAFDRPSRIMLTTGLYDWVNNGVYSRGGSFVGVIFDPAVNEPGLVQPYPVDCTTWQISRGGDCKRYNLQVIVNISRPTDHTQPAEWNVPLDTTGKPMEPVAANCQKPFYDNGVSSYTTWTPVGIGLEGNTVASCPDTVSTWAQPVPSDNILTAMMVQRRLQIFLDAQGEVVPPGTAATPGTVPDPRWLDEGVVQTLSFGENGNHFPLTGIEPALTADGRLMFWQSTRNQYTQDDLGQAGGKYWSYNHDFGTLGVQQVRRHATGYGKIYERPLGVCVPVLIPIVPPLPHPNGCAPNSQCLDATYPNGVTCQNHVPFFAQQNVVYAFRDDPNDPHGWSRPRNLTELFTTHGAGSGSEPMVDGVLFSERYPIAQAPLLHGDGTTTDWIRGQYFWAHPDGNGLVFNERGHAATSYVGAETKHRIIVLDGPINPADANISVTAQIPGIGTVFNRFNWTDRENFFAFGTSPGMWGAVPGQPSATLRSGAGERAQHGAGRPADQQPLGIPVPR